MRPGLIIDLRNRRLRSYLVNEEEVCAGLDVRDSFIQEKGKNGVNKISFESKPDDRHDRTVIFENFLGRVNNFPWAWDFSPVLVPLVQSVCSLIVDSKCVPKCLDLYYLLPLNASENLWQGLPHEPFDANGTTITPSGFVDELMMTLAGALSHTLSYVDSGRFFLLLTIHVDSVPTVLRLCFETIESCSRLILEEVFPIQEVKPEFFAQNMADCFVLEVDCDNHFSDSGNLIKALRNYCITNVSELPSLKTIDLVSGYFSEAQNNGSRSVRLDLRDHSGFLCGTATSIKTPVNTHAYPEQFCSRITLKPGHGRSRLTFFRGHVADSRYCCRFRPFEFEAGHTGRYLGLTTLLSTFGARVELIELNPDGCCTTETLTRDMFLPRPLIC